jgi:hypothetical protein
MLNQLKNCRFLIAAFNLKTRQLNVINAFLNAFNDNLFIVKCLTIID